MPDNIYLFKVNNRNTGKRCQICSKLTMKTPERRYWRYSRTWQTIENAFGILATRWRFFHTPINTNVNRAESFVQAAVALHNYLSQTENPAYIPQGFVDSESGNGVIRPGEWRSICRCDTGGLTSLPKVRGSKYKANAVEMRDTLK